MRKDYESQRGYFHSLHEAEAYADNTFPICEGAWVRFESPNAAVLTEYKGLMQFNGYGYTPTGVVSKDYPIVQHNQVFGAGIEAFVRDGISVEGSYEYDNRGRMYSTFMFKNVLIPDDEKGIALGIRLFNSYTGDQPIRGYGVATRLVCANGMTLRSTIPEMVINLTHRGEIPYGFIVSKVRDLVASTLESQQTIVQKIDFAMAEQVHFESERDMVACIASMVGGERRAKEIKSKLGSRYDITQWELYNAITNVVSREDEALKITPLQKETVLKSAESLLNREYQRPMIVA